MKIELNKDQAKILLNDLLGYKERLEDYLQDESPDDPHNNIEDYKESIELYSVIIKQIRTQNE
jgi:hypothetical protein